MSEPETLLQGWKDWLLLRGLAESTIRSREGHMRQFIHALSSYHGQPVTLRLLSDVDITVLRRWIAERYIAGYQASSQHGAISSLRSFYRYLGNYHHVHNAPVFQLRRPKLSRPLPRALSPPVIEEVMQGVMHGARYEWVGLRDQAIITLLYGAGLRIHEVFQFRLSDFIQPRGEWREAPFSFMIRGKGAKDRLITILPAMQLAIWRYIEACPHELQRDDALFRKMNGRVMQKSDFIARLNRLKKAGHIPAEITSHQFRHSFATHMMESGANIIEVKELLGHQHARTTQIYTAISKERLLVEYQKTFVI